jgi:hypothetical protein
MADKPSGYIMCQKPAAAQPRPPLDADEVSRELALLRHCRSDPKLSAEGQPGSQWTPSEPADRHRLSQIETQYAAITPQEGSPMPGRSQRGSSAIERES